MTTKNTILFLLAAGTGWLALTSNNAGPGISGNGDRSSIGCSGAGCHPAASNSTVISHTLISGGVPVTNNAYIPGATYTVTLVASNTGSATGLTHFGFQTTARRANGTNGGTLSTSTPSTHTYTGSGRTGVEHGPKIASTTGNVYQVSYQWTAPAAGAGAITFNSAVNLVNNDNNISGDQPNVGTTTFQETTVGVVDVNTTPVLTLSPNPATDRFSLDTRAWAAGDYTVSVFSTTGQLVSRHNVEHRGADRAEVRLPALATGLYGVRVQGEGQTQAAPLFVR